MDAGIVAALVLFGPAALALPAIAVAWHRGQRAAAADRAAFRALRTGPQAAPGVPPHTAGQAPPAAGAGGTGPPEATVTRLRPRPGSSGERRRR